ncbi:HD domain-containing phosphohydrolase [Magnetovibrio sp. PR-2]|uniref:HD domain-containing phosphohydrolase n=1 Tax=Magnetovibrio sp. PR-2 TaxID=3120356 RepID=UPI002FCE32FD
MPDDVSENTDNEEREKKLENVKRPMNKFVFIGLILMIAAVGGSIFAAFKFVEDERARSLQEWQIRLGIVGDSRSAAINDWIDDNFSTMRELAENASLQLYMSEIAAAKNPTAVEEDPMMAELGGDELEAEMEGDDPFGGSAGEAEATYLRNILTATAERTGFKPPVEAAAVSANIERAGVAGLGLIDAEGMPVASSPGMPPMIGRLKEAGLKALQGEPQVIDIYIGSSGLPTIGFALPVYGIQDDSGAKGIGAVIGMKIVDETLYSKLVQPGETSETSETYLVRRQGATIEYLSPLADGTPPLKRKLALDTPNLAGAYAVETPGGFAVKRDYHGEEVLMSSRSIAGAPWSLIRKINYVEALAETETRLNTLMTVFILIIVGVTVAVFAVWRHGSSLRATQAAQNFKVSSERFENLSKFMNLISNAQPAGIVSVGRDTVYTYANEPAAKFAGIKAEDMLGKTMAAVIGPIQANVYAEINDKIIKEFKHNEDRDACREMHINTFGDDDDDEQEDLLVIKSDHIPLRGDLDHEPGVLMILEDITELTRERRRSEKMLRQLIDTLVSVVDRRDPFSANHSSHVAEVARAIAEEMHLDEVTAKTVDIAGSLMNLGKIFIPAELLTKTGDLTPEERQTLMSSYLVSVDLLQDVTFEGPVVDTIRDMGETWDGHGPLGKTEEDILISARILAVANAFVGMASARAYRDAMPFEKVSDILLGDTGSKFDRKPVSALINFLENREGKDKWAHYRVRPKLERDENPLE